MGRDNRERLLDIVRHITFAREVEEQLDSFAGSDEARLRTCHLALMYCLIVIGEAVGQVDDEARRRCPDVPWQHIVGMRNLLAHEYFRVDIETVRLTLDAPFRQLEGACLRLLAATD